MAIKITWYSHACFLIETDQTRLLTDPFLTDNPLASGKAGWFKLKRIETEIFQADAIAAADPGQLMGYGQIRYGPFWEY